MQALASKFGNERQLQKAELHRQLEKFYSWSKFELKSQPLRVALIVRDGDWWPKSSVFVRLLSPLTDPSLQDKLGIELLAENSVTVGDVAICIVQRNAYDDLATAKKLVDHLKERHIALVVDTDDAFHDIDRSHPEYDLQKQRTEAFDYLISHASQIWVSTQRLAKHFKKKSKNPIMIVPNSLDKRLWHLDNTQVSNDRPLQILYMGTGSHDADFELIRPTLQQLKPGSFELTMIGAISKPINESWLKRVPQPPFMGSLYLKFVPWFLKQGPFDVGIAPLVDNDFNRSKSDIKCLDYLASGLLPVVSDIEAYATPDLGPYIIRVKNSGFAWQKALSDLSANRQALRQELPSIVASGRDYLWSDRNSSSTAKQLHGLLRQLPRQ